MNSDSTDLKTDINIKKIRESALELKTRYCCNGLRELDLNLPNTLLWISAFRGRSLIGSDGENRCIYTIDFKTGNIIKSLETPLPPMAVAYNGKNFYVGFKGGVIGVYDQQFKKKAWIRHHGINDVISFSVDENSNVFFLSTNFHEKDRIKIINDIFLFKHNKIQLYTRLRNRILGRINANNGRIMCTAIRNLVGTDLIRINGDNLNETCATYFNRTLRVILVIENDILLLGDSIIKISDTFENIYSLSYPPAGFSVRDAFVSKEDGKYQLYGLVEEKTTLEKYIFALQV